ncbi:MAG: hypothetical protein ACLPSH_20840 [Vulcanimicrobiaceae bacterium]
MLDNKISSAHTAAGSVIRTHLKEPLVVNGLTLAPAGAPGSLVVVTTRGSQSGDIDGAVQVHLEPLTLPSGQKLPVRAVHEYLTIERTAGQESTRETTDTLADIFIPYHVFYHAFRKGREMVLPVGSELRAETDATIDADNPHAIVISTPPPFASVYDTPHSDLTPLPFFTPVPVAAPSPRGRPKASASPSASPGSGVSPGPSASPGPAGSPSASPASRSERTP